jgi:broad specificity phosphatase PhoE
VGIRQRYQSVAERRRTLGKLYYRPPGGESWADIVLRLRSFLADLDRTDDSGCALVVCHDAVILLLRYVLEGLTEAQLLDVARGEPLGNASVTRLWRPGPREPWQPLDVNVQDHVPAYGSEPTAHEPEHDVDPR